MEPTAPPRERNEYITLDRLIKYGGTSGCNACEKASGTHTAFCKARFNGLIRPDKIASGHKTPKALEPGPVTPTIAPPTPVVKTTVDEEVVPEASEEVDYSGVAPEDLPFSAGVPRGEEAALIGRITTDIDHKFQEADQLRGRARRVSKEKGKDCLFKYACSDEPISGQRAEQCGIQCIRLSRTVLNLEQTADVDQATGQLASMPCADVWMSITCTYHSPLQHLNEAIHGSEYSKKLRKARKRVMKILDLALPLLELV